MTNVLLLPVLSTPGISEENVKAANWIHPFSVDDDDEAALVLSLEVILLLAEEEVE